MPPRNLVFCCDGTANQYGTVNTNVIHLYKRLADCPEQIARYEPGVGTFSPLGLDDRGFTGRTLGKLFGHGLSENIENGYRFLMRHYRDGDRVFLFGFSRGAYAVRALAGMLRKCGLLYPEQAACVPYARRLYQTRGNDAEAAGFRATFSRPCPVYFMGLWDTVASLGYIYSRRRFFNARLGEDVRAGCHALSIDERRPKFEPLLWDEARAAPDQTIEQVWFAGAHADVGGGYAERGLAEITLQWMLHRATNHGLRIDPAAVPPRPADPAAPMHRPWRSIGGRLLRALHLGSRPRNPPPQARVHQSVEARMDVTDYAPDVLPDDYRVVG